MWHFNDDKEPANLAKLKAEPAGWYRTTIPVAGGSSSPSTSTSQQKQKSSKADKMLRSPFGVYMTEQRPLLENSGVTFSGGWKSVADYLSPQWAELSVEEQSRYRKKSEELKGCGSVSAQFNVQPPPQPKHKPLDEKAIARITKIVKSPQGLTTFGENIISAPEEVMIEYREYYRVRAKIESFLHMNLGEQPRPVEEKTFVAMEFNPYCMDLDGTGDIIPGEWGLCTFSIKSGIKTVTSGLIDPGSTPIGTGSHVKDSIKSLGLLPVGINKESDAINVEGETEDPGCEFKNVLNTINDTLMLYHREFYKKGYIFTMRDNVNVVKRCLKWLCKKTGDPFDYEVLPLSVLMEMCSGLNPRDAYHSRTEVECDRLLNSIQFAYETSLSCDWHLTKERIDSLDKCARNMVKRAVFNMLDYLCPTYNVEMMYPEHMPNEYEYPPRRGPGGFMQINVPGFGIIGRPMSVYSIDSEDSFFTATSSINSDEQSTEDPSAQVSPTENTSAEVSFYSSEESSTDAYSTDDAFSDISSVSTQPSTTEVSTDSYPAKYPRSRSGIGFDKAIFWDILHLKWDN